MRNKNAEQKTVEQKLVGTLGHWVMGKCKKVRRTKTVKQKRSADLLVLALRVLQGPINIFVPPFFVPLTF